jgi:hypothetical protein
MGLSISRKTNCQGWTSDVCIPLVLGVPKFFTTITGNIIITYVSMSLISGRDAVMMAKSLGHWAP